MYCKFAFRNFDNCNLNKRQRHPRGAFIQVFDGTNDKKLLLYCKKRVYQAKLQATAENGATNVVLTPEGYSWNLYSDVYACNKENMLDREGNMTDRKD